MYFRDLFTEMPYGCALYPKYLRHHCSTCFAKPAEMQCENGCGVVVYCAEKCRDADRANHEYECTAFKKSGFESVANDAFARLLGRILTRQKLDNGTVNLCENFPKNVPDRQLADLLPHQEEIEACEYRSEDMNQTFHVYRQIFHDTPLVDDWQYVRRMYCVMWINCFSVSGPMNLKTGHGSNVGLGFYMNTSRFNHSCQPELFVDFNGARIIIQYPSTKLDPIEMEQERSSYTESAERFNNLMISYGYSHSFTNDSFFPLRRQRRESLQFAYYFTCHCPICDDEMEAALEESATLIQCRQCREPYSWQKKTENSKPAWCWSSTDPSKKVTCRKTCKCATDGKEKRSVKAYIRTINANTNLELLEKNWAEVMSDSIQAQYADDVVRVCEPILLKAKKFWHGSRNLRLAQLNERLFVSYNVVITTAAKKNEPIDQKRLKLALDAGESLIAWIRKHPINTYYTAVAAYALELAQLYQIAATVAEDEMKKRDRAADWYYYAATVWMAYGEKARDFVAQLVNNAHDVKRSDVVEMEKA